MIPLFLFIVVVIHFIKHIKTFHHELGYTSGPPDAGQPTQPLKMLWKLIYFSLSTLSTQDHFSLKWSEISPLPQVHTTPNLFFFCFYIFFNLFIPTISYSGRVTGFDS